MIRIAIDGTASSGKGTLAKRVAKALGYAYIDTGAIYRTVALMANRNGIDWSDNDSLAKLAEQLTVAFKWNGDTLSIYCNGENVSAAIRTDSIGDGASQVSIHRSVRKALLGLQRNLANQESVVMDGRDIGTVIIPQAELKIYVDADIDERARRRLEEFINKGFDTDFETVKSDLIRRDYNDKNRSADPLTKASDALFLDTTTLTIDDGVSQIMRWAKESLDKKASRQ